MMFDIWFWYLLILICAEYDFKFDWSVGAGKWPHVLRPYLAVYRKTSPQETQCLQITLSAPKYLSRVIFVREYILIWRVVKCVPDLGLCHLAESTKYRLDVCLQVQRQRSWSRNCYVRVRIFFKHYICKEYHYQNEDYCRQKCFLIENVWNMHACFIKSREHV